MELKQLKYKVSADQQKMDSLCLHRVRQGEDVRSEFNPDGMLGKRGSDAREWK